MNQLACERFVQQLIEMILLAQIDVFLDLFAPNAEMILPNAYCAGKDAIRNALDGMYRTYDSISIDLKRVLYRDDVAFVEWCWSDRKRLSGEAHQMDTVVVLEFDQGLIRRWREYQSPVLNPNA